MKAVVKKIRYWAHWQLLYRIVLAGIGGAVMVCLAAVSLAALLEHIFSFNKATALLFLMLLSFAAYACVILWVFATNNIVRTSASIMMSSVIMWVAI